MKAATRPKRVDDAHIVRLISRLTERDRKIAFDCYEHRVLTTEQLRRLHFTGERTARDRLGELYALRVLDRFRPAWRRGEGSTQHHYVLDEAGARIIAAELDIERTELRWRPAAAIGVASSTKLGHQVAVNDFFTTLAEQARAAGGALSEWYGDRTTHELLAGIVIPDGYGVLELPERKPAHLLLELDRGTESHDRLLDRARSYAKALPRSPLRQIEPVVLFAVPNAARAGTAAQAVASVAAPTSVLVWTPQRRDTTLTQLKRALSPDRDHAR
jgi:protein involved in plasmid replication-relaxation